MRQSVVGKEMLMSGKRNEKWDNSSEYGVNIVPPPQLNWLHVLMQLSAGHGSEKEMEHDEVIFQIIHC